MVSIHTQYMCLPSSTIDTSYPVLRVPSPFSAADATGRLNYAKLVCFIVLYSRVISSRPGAPSSRLAMLPVHEAVAKPKAGRATRQRFVDPVDLGLDPIDLGLDPVDLGLDLVDRIEAEIRKVGNSLLGAPACLWFDNDVAGRE